MRSFLVCMAVLYACVSVAAADPPSKSDRDAKAALALAAAAKGAKVRAPMPREVGVSFPYPVGYEKSISSQLPLVVFVGCKGHKIEGAITAEAKEFTGVKAPAVVIGYPQGKSLYIDSMLSCPAPVLALRKAVDDASKKIDAPLSKDTKKAPSPKDWHVSAEQLTVLLTSLLVGEPQCANGTCSAPATFTRAVAVSTFRQRTRTGIFARFFGRFRR